MAYQTRVPYAGGGSTFAPRRTATVTATRTVTTQTTPGVKEPRRVKLVYFWIVVAIAVILGIIVGILWYYLQAYRKAQFDSTLCPTYIPPTTCPAGCTGTPT